MANDQVQDSLFGYQLHITFRGLCPFVPSEEPEINNKPKWMGVFLVNASPANQEAFKTQAPVHIPYLRFRSGDLEGMPFDLDSKVLMNLTFEDVVIVPPEGSQEGLEVSFAQAVDDRPRQGEANLFNWVPRMEDVLPNAGRVDPSCFSNKVPNDRVVARVHLTQGALRTGELGNIAGIPIRARLGNSRTGVRRQAIASRVVLDLKCSEGPLRLRLRQFNGKSVRELVFRRPRNGVLELEIGNLCKDELLRQLGEPELTRDEAFEPDDDFRWNYLLSEGMVDLRDTPVPMPIEEEIKLPTGDGGGGTDAAKCSPPRTSAASAEALKKMLSIVSEMG